MLSLAIFVIGMIGLQAVRVSFYHQAFNGTDVLLWSLIIAFAAAAIAAFDRILVGSLTPPDAAAGGASTRAVTSATGLSGDRGAAAAGNGDRVAVAAGNGDRPVHLSPREQEVLRLVSEGYSNGMIANRLHLSENTVKTHVENLLTRLNARNRAEAVAAASRQNLI
jgi:DNA-binding CsgD family transcriptional regulator